ncbi:hypothetical protein Fcan01_27550 [Folsomia candida]|uniref:Uncharacterized protein n=1 Tax=Folsomia candida TaxID=158441 RepID=A0A226CXQ7_FOLCA|nr:hypothetical protein Fcan01_27550 [Folsomia candida]
MFNKQIRFTSVPKAITALHWPTNESLASSNIPIVTFHYWILLRLPNQLPFSMNQKKVVVKNSKNPRHLFLTLAIIVHNAVVFNWLVDQWWYPAEHVAPTWNFVFMYYCLILFFMYYCLILFSGVMVFVIHLTYLQEEVVILLNSSQNVEVQHESVCSPYEESIGPPLCWGTMERGAVDNISDYEYALMGGFNQQTMHSLYCVEHATFTAPK